MASPGGWCRSSGIQSSVLNHTSYVVSLAAHSSQHLSAAQMMRAGELLSQLMSCHGICSPYSVNAGWETQTDWLWLMTSDSCCTLRHMLAHTWLLLCITCCVQGLGCSASKSSIRRFVITEKAPTRAFSWLKAATTAFTFKTLLRHYAKQALTPRTLIVKLGPRHKYHEGRAAIRQYANPPP